MDELWQGPVLLLSGVVTLILGGLALHYLEDHPEDRILGVLLTPLQTAMIPLGALLILVGGLWSLVVWGFLILAVVVPLLVVAILAVLLYRAIRRLAA